MKIRQAKDLDVPHLRRLFNEYTSELRLDLSFQQFDKEIEGLPGDYSPPGGELFLALEGDLPVGCVAMRPLAPRICEMKRLYVHPSYRGKGLGKQLIEAIIAAAHRADYSSMRLDTLSSMKAARLLYRAFGFKPIHPYYHNPPGRRRVHGTRPLPACLPNGFSDLSDFLAHEIMNSLTHLAFEF